MPETQICIAGKNEIAVSALLFLIDRGWKDRLLVCPNRTDSGRSNWQPSLIRFAKEYGVRIITLRQAEEIDNLIFMSLEFDQIIKPANFKSTRLYNIHFSALPAYKGMYTSALPILHGANETGVTLHNIDTGIDTGDIISQKLIEIPENWTARELYFTYMARGLDLFKENFDILVTEENPLSTAQPSARSTYYSKAAIDYGNISINLRDTANGIVRQLRAFSFREYQTPVVDGMEVGSWTISGTRSRQKPGTITARSSDSLVLSTIDHDLRLDRHKCWDWFSEDLERSMHDLDACYINMTDRSGWTPLIRASYGGKIELCHRLLAAGADPNISNMNGTTPLMYAASGPDSGTAHKIVRLLLDAGADPSCPDRFGKTLHQYHPEVTHA